MLYSFLALQAKRAAVETEKLAYTVETDSPTSGIVSFFLWPTIFLIKLQSCHLHNKMKCAVDFAKCVYIWEAWYWFKILWNLFGTVLSGAVSLTEDFTISCGCVRNHNICFYVFEGLNVSFHGGLAQAANWPCLNWCRYKWEPGTMLICQKIVIQQIPVGPVWRDGNGRESETWEKLVFLFLYFLSSSKQWKIVK